MDKEKIKMKSRKLGIALLVLLAFVTTTGSFAYWASSVTGPTAGETVGTVTVGTGNAVTTSFTLDNSTSTGGLLVPATQLANSAAGAVSSVTVTYDVLWSETSGQLGGTSSTATLTVTPVVTLTDSLGASVTTQAVLDLITVTPNVGNTSSLDLNAATASTLSWTITMSEPNNQAEYDEIAGGEITVTFTWALSGIVTTDN